MEEIIAEGKLSSEEIKEIRKLIVDVASNIDISSGKRLKLSDIDCSKELLDKIVFDNFKTQSGDTYKKIFDELNKLMSKIDFDGVNISGADFTGSKGVKINHPQTIYRKTLNSTKLAVVKFIGSFNDAKMDDETSLDGSNVKYIDSCKRVKKSIKKLIK